MNALRPAIVSKLNRAFVALRQTVIIVVITALLMELGLRILHRIYPLPIFYSESLNRFRAKPFSPWFGFRLNSRGFMDVEFKIAKEEGTLRILGIGDSFAFGVVPFPNNYLTLLEDALNRSGGKVELINMGIPGTNPREYLALLIHEGLELKPDMVLLSFFVGNDFTEVRKIRRIFRYSYFATLLKFVYDLNTKFVSVPLGGDYSYDEQSTRVTDAAHIEWERVISHIFLRQSRDFDALLANTVDHLRNIKRICDWHGIRLTLVLIPDEVQVDLALQQKVVEAWQLGSDAFDFNLPNRLLRDRLTELHIDHIDLLQPFRAAATSTRLYKRNDTHWNIKGNELASELILEHLLPQLSH